MRRREFIAGLGGAAVWPGAARAQQPPSPVIGFLDHGLADPSKDRVQEFRRGLSEAGYVEGENVTVEYHWLEDQIDSAPARIADLVRRRAAGIVTFGSTDLAIKAKAGTATVPIVFAVGEDPVKLGLVASLARPGGNVTGVTFFFTDAVRTRLALLQELVPKAVRVAVLSPNSSKPECRSNLDGVRAAAGAGGLLIRILNAATNGEIDAAFATFARDRPDALFVTPDPFFTSRRERLIGLAAQERIPAAYARREIVAAGGLMSYGTNIADSYRQVGIYIGSILAGAKPADLPVVQSTGFRFVINLQTARALGIDVPPILLALTDEVIE